jgi:hypothetical protein
MITAREGASWRILPEKIIGHLVETLDLLPRGVQGRERYSISVRRATGRAVFGFQLRIDAFDTGDTSCNVDVRSLEGYILSAHKADDSRKESTVVALGASTLSSAIFLSFLHAPGRAVL